MVRTNQKEDHQCGRLERIVLSGGFSVFCSRIPFRRNQDVILIQQDCGDAGDVVSVVDGWNDIERISSDHTGRETASFVASRYPEAFLALKERTFTHTAQDAAEQVDREFLDQYPTHVASVGAFVFCFRKQTVLVSVGTVHSWIWNGIHGTNPKKSEITFCPSPNTKAWREHSGAVES